LGLSFWQLELGAMMDWGACWRSIAVGGVCLTATLAAGGLLEPAHAQMMQQVYGSQAGSSQASGSQGSSQASGFNALDPQWAFANPFMSPGFGAGSIGMNQDAYTTKFGSGTVGLFVESNARDSSNFFGAMPALPSQQDWFTALGDPVSRTSIFGSYKSDPKTALFDGLYTTASFGVTSFKTSPSLPGLANFSGNNDVTAVTASVGAGLQLTPQISIEGSVSFTQMPNSNFR
jgi:hypothetical protein